MRLFVDVLKGSSRDVMAKGLDYDILVCEFEI